MRGNVPQSHSPVAPSLQRRPHCLSAVVGHARGLQGEDGPPVALTREQDLEDRCLMPGPIQICQIPWLYLPALCWETRFHCLADCRKQGENPPWPVDMDDDLLVHSWLTQSGRGRPAHILGARRWLPISPCTNGSRVRTFPETCREGL